MLETANWFTPSPGNASTRPDAHRTCAHSDRSALSYQRPPIVPRCSCKAPGKDVKCMEQPRSGRRCSSYARTARRLWKRSDPRIWRFPNASRTSHSLDTGGGLLHGYLRRDRAGPSWRTVIRRTVVKGKSAVLTGDLLNFKSGALRRLSGWAPFSCPLLSFPKLAGSAGVSPASRRRSRPPFCRREHAGKMPALRMRARQVGHHNKCAVLPGKQNANQLGIFRRSLPSERTAPCRVSGGNPLPRP